MEVPGIVEATLDGEDVVDRVALGGDDELFVTASRTLVYRSEGLLSDESVETYDHDAEVLAISEGRRKTRVTLTYPIEGTEEFTLPGKRADAAIPPILAGVLRANGVIAEGEAVLDTFLFSELTLVVTEDRLVKHIGEAVWDLEFEEYPYAEVTGVSAEEGAVATQLVLAVEGGAQRIKTPSDRAREVRQALEDALRSYHGLRPNEDISSALGAEEDEAESPADAEDAEAGTDAGSGMDFGEGVDPLDAGDTRNIGEEPDVERIESPRSAGTDGSNADHAASDSDVGDATTATGGAEEARDADADAPDRQPPNDEGSDDSRATDRSEQRATARSEDRSSSGTDAAGSADRSREPSSQTDRQDDGDSGSEADADDHSTGDDSTDDSRPDDADEAFEAAGFEPAEEGVEALSNEVAELRTAVQKQNKLLVRQHKTIEKLVEELRRGR